ncbi:MAG: hypothetical protein KKH11_06290, partial [Candidatus Omnitrophica bacterium]|nr:hypothetical protein [Candidatus Omnitrophota bacterium]
AKYPKLLAKMVKAGFKLLSLGIESPHDYILDQLNKGFDSNTIRKAFTVLKKYPIFYHGFFIYGNLGETEEEMLYIAEFSKEIDVDSIAFSKLRVDKYSPLREMAKKTPGYHVTDRGELYSDKYSHPALKRIGRRIKFSFYTPSRFLKMLSKCFFVVRIFTFSETVSFLVVMPRVLKSVIVREIQKGRFGDTLKRVFISNES